MSGFFNYDNPVWRFIGKFADIFLLNVLWIICSLPIVTIGASTTAVYYVTLKMVRDEDSYTIRLFFKAFRENFRQATVIWLIMMMVGIILGFDIWFFTGLKNVAETLKLAMTAVFGAFLLIYTMISIYVYPLQSRFYNPVRKTLLNAFFMSIRHLFHTAAILIIDIGLFVIAVSYAPALLMFLFVFGFPLLAFLNSYFFNMVFDHYIPAGEREDGELRPLFAEEEKGH